MQMIELDYFNPKSRDLILTKMATSGGSLGSERQGLAQYVKSQTKYGTATRLLPKSSSFIKHIITDKDTLIGIALKYAVTVEEINRENKMWTNDSVFLREYLLIPLTSQNMSNVPENIEIITIDPTSRAVNGPSLMKSKSLDVTSNTNKYAASRQSNTMDDAKELLSKFDSNFDKLKLDIKKMEENSRFLEFSDDNPLTMLPRKSSRGRPKNLERRSYTIDNTSSSPVLVIRSRMQMEQVQTRVQRSQNANDDLFQL